MTFFTDLGLIEPLCRALEAEGYTQPTPIQAQAIPQMLAGHDLLAIAQTGTGKTAAFALPVLQFLHQVPGKRMPRSARALVLAPTRELAVQINDAFAAYGQFMPLKRATVFGGVGQYPQVQALMRGVDVLVATPGRLIDLMQQGHINLGGVEFFVLDEADRMLDMGFIHDVRRIVAQVPAKRHTVLFSATMPAMVATLAETILKNAVRVEVTPTATTVERIEQRVLFVDHGDKRKLLVDLLRGEGVGRTIVFTRTKHGANRIAEQLQKSGLPADAIHGNKSQGARQRALEDFRTGRLKTLVATDIAARGIDIDGVTHVINFDLPNEPESYVHRIGRTARAGAEGIALSFCGHDEVAYLKAIEKTIRQPVPMDDAHAYHSDDIARRHTRGHSDGRPNKAKAPSKPQGQHQRTTTTARPPRPRHAA
mgnify:FL=1